MKNLTIILIGLFLTFSISCGGSNSGSSSQTSDNTTSLEPIDNSDESNTSDTDNTEDKGFFSFRADAFSTKSSNESLCYSSCGLEIGESPLNLILNNAASEAIFYTSNSELYFSGDLNSDTGYFTFTLEFTNLSGVLEELSCVGVVNAEVDYTSLCDGMIEASCSSSSTGSCKLFWDPL